MLTGHAQLEAAEAALATGDDDAAVEMAERAAADGLVEARFLLGGLRLMDERYDDAREQWEVAFEGLRAQGDHRLAARAAIELAELHAATLGHPSAANGWLEPARRELDLVGPCAERGYLELAVMGCDRGPTSFRITWRAPSSRVSWCQPSASCCRACASQPLKRWLAT